MACYMAGMFGVGIILFKRSHTVNNFLMAGRKLSIPLLIGTILATAVGTGTTIAAAGLGYRGGWIGSAYGVGGAIGLFLLGFLFAKIRRYNFMTMAEEIAAYYGGNRIVYNITIVFIFLTEVCWVGVHLMGAGLYLNYITNMPIQSGIIIAGIGFSVYTILGGYLAVVYTDLIQSVILITGFVFLGVSTYFVMGGYEGLSSSVPAEYLSFLGWEAVGWKGAMNPVVAIALAVLASPTFRHRIYTGNNIITVRTSFYITGIVFLLFSIIPSVIGMSAYGLGADLSSSDLALPWLAMQIFPVWIAAIVIVAALSATMSSADSDIAVGSLIFLRHIYPMVFKQYPSNPVLVSRYIIAAMFLVAVGIVLQFETIMDYIITIVPVIMVGLVVCAVCGLYWKRSTWQGAVAAIASSTIVSLLILSVDSLENLWGGPVIPAFLFSICGMVLVSLLTTPARLSIQTVAEQYERERNAID